MNKVVDRFADFLALAEQAGVMELIAPIIPFLQEMVFGGVQTGGFFGAPASTRFHGCFAGGLYDHSRAVYLRLKEYTEKLGLAWCRPESPFIVAMFHDLCKCDSYIGQVDGYIYNPNQDRRHAEKSLEIIQRYIKLTEEEILCIRWHMGAYSGKEDWSSIDSAIKQYETVQWLHHCDMLASKVDKT